MRRRLVALAFLLGALFAGAFAFAAGASAHATLVASNPVNGSRLKAAPAQVTITFDEAVGLGSVGYLHVVDQSGRRVDVGSAFHVNGQGAVIAVRLKNGLGDGTYTESFRIISADSHPVAGTVRFVVGNGVLSTGAAGAGATTDHVTGWVFDVVRWLGYAGFAVLGGAWLLVTVWPGGRDEPRARRLLWTGWGAALAGAAGELVLQGPYTGGEAVAKVSSWPLLDGTLHSDYGHYHSARLLLLGLFALALTWLLERERSPVDVGVIAVCVGGIAVTYSAIGHAATTNPTWLSIASDVLHLGAMATWVGGLAMLLIAVLPRRDADEIAAALPVFSTVAFSAVGVMAVTGGYAAWRGVGTVDAIFTTTYGLLVSLKVLLFLGLVALGNVSRRAVSRRAVGRRGRGLNAEIVRRAVAVEVVIALGVLAATGTLVAEPRGKEVLTARHLKSVSRSVALPDHRVVTVTVDPGTHGTVATSVALSAGAKPLSVTGTAALPKQQIGPIPLGLTAEGSNLYGASGVTLPAAGNWVFALVVRTDEFTATTVDVTIHLY